jgi:hypothetical protein
MVKIIDSKTTRKDRKGVLLCNKITIDILYLDM